MSFKTDFDEKRTGKVSVTAGSCGIGFCGLLTIVFIVLKLCNVVTWNWFWALSPIIFSFGLGVLMVVIAAIVVAIANRND